MKNIRDTLFHHIEKLPFAWHVRHQTGEIIQRCTSDVEVIRNFVCNQMPDVFRIVFPDGSVSGHHVFHEREALPDVGCFYSGRRGLFRLLLCQDRRPVYESG